MKLSDGEKLILAMLCEIYVHCKMEGQIDHNLVRSVLETGNYWELVWQYPEIFNEHEDNNDSFKEMVNILDMWILIETSYEKLSSDDKSKIINQMRGHRKDIQFFGFHDRNELECLDIARL